MQLPNITVDKNQMETTEHGTHAFPFAIYENLMSRNNNNTINWAWHDELQLNYVVHGAISIYLYNKVLTLHEGEGAFINKGVLHMTTTVDDPDSIMLCVNFHPRMLSGFAGSVYESQYVRPYVGNPLWSERRFVPEVPWQKKILQKTLMLNRCYNEKKERYEIDILTTLLKIWKLIIENALPAPGDKPSASRQRHNDIVQGILTYLHEHFSEDISVEDIAGAITLSPEECCRTFKKVTRDTIFNYLRTYRITQSTDMLKNTDRSVTDIAYACGFSSSSHFIASFKKTMGMTPLQYRKI